MRSTFGGPSFWPWGRSFWRPRRRTLKGTRWLNPETDIYCNSGESLCRCICRNLGKSRGRSATTGRENRSPVACMARANRMGGCDWRGPPSLLQSIFLSWHWKGHLSCIRTAARVRYNWTLRIGKKSNVPRCGNDDGRRRLCRRVSCYSLLGRCILRSGPCFSGPIGGTKA